MGSVLIPTWTLGLNIKIHYNFVPRRRVDTTEGIGGGGGENVMWASEWGGVNYGYHPTRGSRGTHPPPFFFTRGRAGGKKGKKMHSFRATALPSTPPIDNLTCLPQLWLWWWLLTMMLSRTFILSSLSLLLLLLPLKNPFNWLIWGPSVNPAQVTESEVSSKPRCHYSSFLRGKKIKKEKRKRGYYFT